MPSSNAIKSRVVHLVKGDSFTTNSCNRLRIILGRQGTHLLPYEHHCIFVDPPHGEIINIHGNTRVYLQELRLAQEIQLIPFIT